MAVKNTPIAIGGAGLVHDAADFRQAVVAAFPGTADMRPVGGVIAGWGDELGVSVGTGLQTVVGSGLILIPAPDPAEGGWIVPNDGDLEINHAAAHPSNARIDRIIARVSDSTITSHAGADNTAAIEVVTGIASGTPAVPTIPTSKGEYIELRRVAVGASATSLDADDLTLPPGGVPIVGQGSFFWRGADHSNVTLAASNNGPGGSSWNITTPSGAALLTVAANLTTNSPGSVWEAVIGLQIDGVTHSASMTLVAGVGASFHGSVVVPLLAGTHTMVPRYATGTGGGLLTFVSASYTLVMGRELT